MTERSRLRTLRDTLQRVKEVFRKEGMRGVIRHFGWKIVAVFLIYYLVRDVTLYIVIPYFALRGCVSS